MIKEANQPTDHIDQAYKLRVSDDIATQLDLHPSESVFVETDDTQLTIVFNRPGAKKNVLTSWVAIPTLISSFLFFVFFFLKKTDQLALTGKTSIAAGVLVLGLISGIVSFITFYIKTKKTTDIYWRNFPTVVLSFTMIVSLAMLVFFKVMNQVFYGISFDLYTSTFLFMILVSVINYSMIFMAISLTPRLLTNVLILVIIGGVLTAMLTNTEQQWWQYNLSFLGTNEASNSWTFNLTLIISSLIMIALVDYLFVILKKNTTYTYKLLTLRILLTTTAICLGGVGFFPYNDNVFSQQMHNRSAGYLVYLIIILIIALKWLLPEIPKSFLRLSYLVAISLSGAIFLFLGIDYLSLTAFELIAFLIAFSWLLLLLSHLRAIAHTSHHRYASTLEIIPAEIVDKM